MDWDEIVALAKAREATLAKLDEIGAADPARARACQYCKPILDVVVAIVAEGIQDDVALAFKEAAES